MIDRNPKQFHIDQPIFRGAQSMVIRCQVDGCGWNACGPRADLKLAWNDHYRQYHSEEVGTMMFDKKLRDEIWIPTPRRTRDAA